MYINVILPGNITAVATGENHIIGSGGNYIRSPGNTLTRGSTELNNLGLVASNACIDTNPSIYPCGPQMLTLPPQEPSCTLQNCELNSTMVARLSQTCQIDQSRDEPLPMSVQPIATVSHCVPTNNQIILDRKSL